MLIEIKAASLNFPDLLIVQNKYQMKPPLPFVPGSEYAGVVAAVGDGVTHLKVGQNVACLSGTGGFGTHTIAPAALCMPLPDGFSHVDAAAFIMIYATSHHALVDRAQLKAGETVLVLGAAGGVGTAAIQIAKAMGARVIAAASSDEKCALCTSIGADATINYSKENLRDAIKALTDGKGPDVPGIAEAMLQLTEERRSLNGKLRQKRMETSEAIHQEFGWDSLVKDYWRPLLVDVLEHINNGGHNGIT